MKKTETNNFKDKDKSYRDMVNGALPYFIKKYGRGMAMDIRNQLFRREYEEDPLQYVIEKETGIYAIIRREDAKDPCLSGLLLEMWKIRLGEIKSEN